MSTEIAGTLKRLRPGDQARVKVGVVNKKGVGRGTIGSAVAVIKDEEENEVARSGVFEVIAGIPVYTDEWSSLALHEVGVTILGIPIAAHMVCYFRHRSGWRTASLVFLCTG